MSNLSNLYDAMKTAGAAGLTLRVEEQGLAAPMQFVIEKAKCEGTEPALIVFVGSEQTQPWRDWVDGDGYDLEEDQMPSWYQAAELLADMLMGAE